MQNLTIIGLSLWLNKKSKHSILLRDKKHVNLPNAIDVELFKPINDLDKDFQLSN